MKLIYLDIFKYLCGPIIVGIIMLVAQFFLQPLIQEKIKAQEELWLHKKQVYIKAIELVDKRFDSMIFGNSEPIAKEPTTKEINDVFRDLLMVCDNEKIIISFSKFMDISVEGYCCPINRGAFIKLLRKDLGKSTLTIEDDKIPYFRTHSNK